MQIRCSDSCSHVSHALLAAKNEKELDRKILSERVSFPSFLTGECVGLLKGLLERDP